MKKYLLFFIFLFSYFYFFAQQDAWVYFVDKQEILYPISNPNTFLTQKAINRKNAHGVTIDTRDIPVNETYISQLKNVSGITVMAKSKWFNAVHVRGSVVDINNLTNSFSFVDHIDFADKSLNKSVKVKQKKQSKLESTLTVFNYGSAANQIQMIKGEQLHLVNYTGTGMTVAVLDAGFPKVNTMAGFLRLRNANNILGTYNFVNRVNDVYSNTYNNHGTLVLSTMAGYVENNYVGTAPDASYYLFMTEDVSDENPVEESYWVEAVERADSLGVDIINTSLGYKDYSPNYPSYTYTPSQLNGNTAFITKGANIAFEKGMLLINSAGNEGNGGVNAPADAAGVFTIGAVNASGTYASFSSVGSTYQPTQKPDVVAQGQGSVLITENDMIAAANGTSFSSPIMAGGMVCLWQALPNRTNAEIMQLVRESASQYNNPNYFLGYGIPNLQIALNAALLVDQQSLSEDLKVFPNPTNNKIYFKIPTTEKLVSIIIFDVLGNQVLNSFLTPGTNEIDMFHLSAGLYMVNFRSENISKTIKLIKK